MGVMDRASPSSYVRRTISERCHSRIGVAVVGPKHSRLMLHRYKNVVLSQISNPALLGATDIDVDLTSVEATRFD